MKREKKKCMIDEHNQVYAAASLGNQKRFQIIKFEDPETETQKR